MKKDILIPVILDVALTMLPQTAKSQSTYLDPFANYQRLELYQRREMLKSADKIAAKPESAPKSKSEQIELSKHKIRPGMTKDEFLAAHAAGRRYVDEGNLEKAHVILAGLAEIDTGDVDANASVQESLGLVFYLEGTDEKALSHFNAGLDRNNRMVQAMLFRAKIYLKQKKYYNASSDLEFLLEVTLPENEADKPGSTQELAAEVRKILDEANKNIYK